MTLLLAGSIIFRESGEKYEETLIIFLLGYGPPSFGSLAIFSSCAER